MRTIPWLLAALGCGTTVPDEIPEEEFATWAAAVSCERTQECALSAFEVAYYGMADCRASEERAWATTVDLLKDCDYSESRASDRLRDVQEMDCDDWYEGDAQEALAEVWGDCTPA